MLFRQCKRSASSFSLGIKRYWHAPVNCEITLSYSVKCILNKELKGVCGNNDGTKEMENGRRACHHKRDQGEKKGWWDMQKIFR